MKIQLVPRDERAIVVENASYRWAYLLLSFGLLISAVYRSFVLGQSSWDLLALVLLGGAVTTVYQGLHHMLSGRWAVLVVLTMFIACALAFVILLLS